MTTPWLLLFLPLGTVARTYTHRLRWNVLRSPLYWTLWVIVAALAGKVLLYTGMPWNQTDWLYALPQAFVRLIFEVHPAELVLLIGSGVAWYLGGHVVDAASTHGRLLANFEFGLVMLLAAALASNELSIQILNPVLPALAFFALSLGGIALTRSPQEGSGRTSGNRQFAVSLISVIIVVSALGLLASIAITPDLVGVIIKVGKFILYALLGLLAFLFSLLPDPDLSAGELPPPPAVGDDRGVMDFFRSLPLSDLFRRVTRILWTVTVLAMLLTALWRISSAVLDWLRRRGNTAGVEMERLDSGLFADLRAWLDWLLRRPAALGRRILGYALTRMATRQTVSWRTVYAGMLAWAGKRLRSRGASESAHEYTAALTGMLPAAAPDLAYVTETYARARYGGYEPDRDSVIEMQQAVQRIKSKLRRQYHTDAQDR